jgi:hypothetical protein
VLTWQRPWPRSPSWLREESDLHRLDEDPVRVVLSQPHSTGRLSPKRYENRYDQELQIDRSMPAPATTRTWGWHRGCGGAGHSYLTSFSLGGEYTSDTLSERRGSILRASVAILMLGDLSGTQGQIKAPFAG